MSRLHIIRFTVFVIFLALLLSVALTIPALAQEATPAATPTIIVTAAWQPGLLTVDANTSADFNLDPGEGQNTLRVLQAGTYPVEIDTNSQADWLHIRMSDGIEGYIASASNVTLSPITAPTVAPNEQPPVTVNIEQPPTAESPDSQERMATALIIGFAIANGALVFFAAAFVVFARHLKESTPSWVADLLKIYLPKVLEMGTVAVESTSTPIDDDVWDALKPRLQTFLIEAGLMTAPDTSRG